MTGSDIALIIFVVAIFLSVMEQIELASDRLSGAVERLL